jgi:uncharacterized protein YkwD
LHGAVCFVLEQAARAVRPRHIRGELMREIRCLLIVMLTCGTSVAGCEPGHDDALSDRVQLGEPVSESRLEALDPPASGEQTTVEESAAGTGETLCRACTTNAECGGSGALCLRRSDGAQFCGRDCRTAACPSRYTCMRLSTTISQCVPPQLQCTLASADAGTPPPSTSADAGGAADAGASADVPSTAYCAPAASWDPRWIAFEAEVLRLTNLARQSARLCGTTSYAAAPALTASSQLRCAARLHAKDMQDRSYFSHTSPTGVTFSQRSSAAGYLWRTVGENIASGYASPQAVVDGWLASPGHCQNLMSRAFTELGVGFYGSNRWVQDFGASL